MKGEVIDTECPPRVNSSIGHCRFQSKIEGVNVEYWLDCGTFERFRRGLDLDCRCNRFRNRVNKNFHTFA